MDDLIKKYTLINAVEHDGVAQPKSVLGKLLAEHPEMRDQVQRLSGEIEAAVREINRLSPSQQKNELDKTGGYVPVKRVERKGLPELERGREKFIVRFAPNPDGALHVVIQGLLFYATNMRRNTAANLYCVLTIQIQR